MNNIFDEMNKIKSDFENVIEKLHNHDEEDMAINIIIYNTDQGEPVFVEIENDSGESISIGERSTTDEGYLKLRINTADIINHNKI